MSAANREVEAMMANIERYWLIGMVGILAGCYLVLGTIVGGTAGVAGIIGGVLIVLALVFRGRARWIAGVLLLLGALPFAALLWWSVIVPILALVTLVLGVLVIVRRGDLQLPVNRRPAA
jgi:hypothetical protein